MARPKSEGDLYTKSELIKVSEMYFNENMTYKEIGDKLHFSRGKVISMCEAARKNGIVRIIIEPDDQEKKFQYLDLYARKIQRKYNLKVCRLVNSPSSISGNDYPALQATVVDDIARVAAHELDAQLSQMRAPTLAVCYGVMCRKIVNYIPDSVTRKEHGTILAAQGTRSTKLDRFDANDLTRDLWRRYGSEYHCLTVPAIERNELAESLVQCKHVKDVLDMLEQKTNIVLASVGGIQSGKTDHKPQLFETIFQVGDIEEIVSKGGVGNIGGMWFGADGKHIRLDKKTVIGMSLQRLVELVEDDKPVILAAGADKSRIPAIAVALRYGLANIWIGDEYTARALLGEPEIVPTTVDWKPSERAIMSSLASDRGEY